MLQALKDRGFVVGVTNFVDEYLLSAKNADPRTIPYLVEQHWPDVAEELIQVCVPD